jgi:GNAT superfamily N-acetyltransferase
MIEIIPLGRPHREPTETFPQLKPLNIIGPRGGWDFARQLGMYPELEWSYPILTQRTWMLSSAVPAFFYEPLTEFDQVREVASLGRELEGARKGVLDVSVGFRYFDRFYRTTNGRLELPGPEERLRGRHWVNVGGVQDADHLHFRNSWGEGWGDHGFGYLSREYFDANVTGAYAAWPSDTGSSSKMMNCLEAAERKGLRHDHWVECWPTPNEFWVDGMLIDGVRHSTISWAVRSFETGRPVYVCELRNPARVLARLHVHGPALEGGAFSIRELFVLPLARRRGLGSMLEASAAERVRELGGGTIEAWINTPDDLPRTAPASHGFAESCGYQLEESGRDHLDVTKIGRKEVS